MEKNNQILTSLRSLNIELGNYSEGFHAQYNINEIIKENLNLQENL